MRPAPVQTPAVSLNVQIVQMQILLSRPDDLARLFTRHGLLRPAESAYRVQALQAALETLIQLRNGPRPTP